MVAHVISTFAGRLQETEQVEFQALALHHPFAGQVTDADFRKVGLTRDGAETREFGAVESHQIFILGMLVLECLKYLRIVFCRIFHPGTA